MAAAEGHSGAGVQGAGSQATREECGNGDTSPSPSRAKRWAQSRIQSRRDDITTPNGEFLLEVVREASLSLWGAGPADSRTPGNTMTPTVRQQVAPGNIEDGRCRVARKQCKYADRISR